MTPAQMQEARQVLGWSISKLAFHGTTTAHIVTTYEQTGRVARTYGIRRRSDDPVGSVKAALEAAGIVFTNGDKPGVRLRKAEG